MGFLWRRIVGLLVFFAVIGLGWVLVSTWDASSGGTLLAGRNALLVPLAILAAAVIASWLVRAAMRARTRAIRRELRRRYR